MKKRRAEHEVWRRRSRGGAMRWAVGMASVLGVACASAQGDPNPADTRPDARGEDPLDATSDRQDLPLAEGGAPRDAGDRAADAANGVPTPQPPAGSTRCGAGTLSASDVASACNEPNPLSVRNGCAYISTQGARYEVWCSDAATYVWVAVDALRATGSTCPLGTANFGIDINGSYTRETNSGIGSGNTDASPAGSVGSGRSFALTATAPGAANGTMTLWAHGSDCRVEGQGTPSYVIAGARVRWQR